MTDITKPLASVMTAEGDGSASISLARKIANNKTMSKEIFEEAHLRKDTSVGITQWMIDFIRRLVELILGLIDKEKTERLNVDARNAAERFFDKHKQALSAISTPAATTGRLETSTSSVKIESAGPRKLSWWEQPIFPSLTSASKAPGGGGGGSGGGSGGGGGRSKSYRGGGQTKDRYTEDESGSGSAEADQQGGENNLGKSPRGSRDNGFDPKKTTIGSLVKHGEDYFLHKPPPKKDAWRVKKSYFVTIMKDDGETETRWGKELKRLMEDEKPIIGDRISLTLLGKETVVTEVKQERKDGSGEHEWVQKPVERNKWVLDALGEENIPKAPRRKP